MAKNYTLERVLAAVEKSNGIMDCVAAALGCSWATAKTYVDKYPAAVYAMEAQQSKFTKLVSERIVSAIRRGDKWAIERAADSIARRAGFGIIQRQEIDHTTGGQPFMPPQIVVRYVDPPSAAKQAKPAKG